MDSVKDFLSPYMSVSTQRLLWQTSLYLIVASILYIYCYLLVGVFVAAVALSYAFDYIDKTTAPTIEPTEKYVFITGCDSGFGLDSAKALRDLGFYVIAGCYDPTSDGARQLKDRPWVKKIEVVHLDVTSEASVQAAVKEVKDICSEQGLWGVINNAGVNCQGPAELLPMTSYNHTAQVNLFGAVCVIKYCLPLVRKAQGRIINVTSERAFNHWAFSTPYCITKAGLEAYSNCLRREMRQHKVKVITVAPGHFAKATAICNNKINSAMKENVLLERSKLSSKEQEAYPLESIDELFQTLEPDMLDKAGHVTSDAVVSSFVDALTRVHPKDTYLVHGLQRQCLDPLIVLAQIRPFVPDCIIESLERVLFWLL